MPTLRRTWSSCDVVSSPAQRRLPVAKTHTERPPNGQRCRDCHNWLRRGGWNAPAQP